MLRIKLARFGKKNQPHYRFVVTEAKSKRDGKYTESIGQYAPTQEPKILSVDTKAYHSWIGKGATPTDTVAALVRRFESGNPFPKKAAKPSKKSVAKAAAAKEAKAAADAAPPVVEAPEAEVANEAATETTEAPEAEAPAEATKTE